MKHRKYPKRSIITFVEFGKNDFRQVNLHLGSQYGYWFIEPNKLPVKLPKGEIPEQLIGKLDTKFIEYAQK